MELDVKMSSERRKQIKKDQEDSNIQVVKLSKKKDGKGYHVSGSHFERFSMLQYGCFQE